MSDKPVILESILFIQSVIHSFNKYVCSSFITKAKLDFWLDLQKFIAMWPPHCAVCCHTLLLAINIYKHLSIWPVNVKLRRYILQLSLQKCDRGNGLMSPIGVEKHLMKIIVTWLLFKDTTCQLLSCTWIISCLAKYFRMVFIAVPWHPPGVQVTIISIFNGNSLIT